MQNSRIGHRGLPTLFTIKPARRRPYNGSQPFVVLASRRHRDHEPSQERVFARGSVYSWVIGTSDLEDRGDDSFARARIAESQSMIGSAPDWFPQRPTVGRLQRDPSVHGPPPDTRDFYSFRTISGSGSRFSTSRAAPGSYQPPPLLAKAVADDYRNHRDRTFDCAKECARLARA